MKKSKFNGEQIAFGLRQAEVGTPVAEACRKMGVCDATYACRCPRKVEQWRRYYYEDRPHGAIGNKPR